jgi:hypothetical protein
MLFALRLVVADMHIGAMQIPLLLPAGKLSRPTILLVEVPPGFDVEGVGRTSSHGQEGACIAQMAAP